MSEFQKQLDEEIDKRGLKESDPELVPKSKKSFFSFTYFIKGAILCALFVAALVGWAWFKSDDTAQVLSEKLASKTTLIKKDISNVYRLSDAQPVLKMPSVDLTDNTPTPKNETPKEPPVVVKGDTKESLVSAPVPGLYESASEGLLPMIRKEDNLSPFEAYKRPFQKKSKKPLLSIVFFDVGLSRKVTEGLIENFPADVTFSFSPYARELKLLSDVARQDGHEVWLTLPMQTKTYPLNDPGPSTLLVNASVEQNKGRLTSILASTQGYAGFVSQKEHAFKREDANVNPSIQEIFDRGLAVLDSNPSLYSFVGGLASKNDYPNAKNNFWLDDVVTPLALNKKIRQMIEYGQSGGSIIVMLHPNPTSIKALQKFLHSTAAETFQLAPVSAQVTYGE